MRIRILPALALLPLVAACAAPTEPQGPVVQEIQVAVPVTAAAPVIPRPAPPAPPALAPASTTATGLPGGPPVVRQTLGAPPPPAEEPLGEGEALGEEEAAGPEEPAAPEAPGRLGTTVASLGPPTEAGLWLETALVTAPTTGRVEYNGQSVTVQLRPSGGEPGSGSQISLEAMRALGAPLTGLPELTVFSG